MLGINAETGELDPELLAEEVTRAENFRRKHTARTAEIVRRLMGNWFRSDNACDPVPENLIASFVTFMLAEMGYAAPSCRVTTRRPVTLEDIRGWMEQYLQQWVPDNEFGSEHRDVVRDMLVGFGVVKVGMEPSDPHPTLRGKGGLKPFAERIPRDRFILDPRCESPRRARMMGDTYFKDLEELRAAPDRWDPAAVERMSGDADGSTESTTERAVKPGETAERGRVMLSDLWIPELGKIVTLARDGSGNSSGGGGVSPSILRQFNYVGPPCGPYEIYGCYTIEGDPYPISALQFAMEQFEELQAHLVSAGEAAKNYKRFVLVDAGNPQAEAAVLNAENGQVCPIKGLNSNTIAQIELGGPHGEQLNYIMETRERWDRVIGMGDAQRGRAQGKTATESQIVQSNVDGRVADMKAQDYMHTARVLWKVGWYAYYNPLVASDVNAVDPFTGEMSEGVFYGGQTPEQESLGISWDMFDVEILAESMSRVDDQVLQGRAMQINQMLPSWYQMLTTMPGANVRYAIDQFGESMNIKKLSTVLFSPQLLAMTAQIPQLFGVGVPQPLPGNVNPQLVQAGLGVPAQPPQPPQPAGGPQGRGFGFPQRQLPGPAGAGGAGGGGGLMKQPQPRPVMAGVR